VRLIRYLPAHSIRDNGTAVQSPDVWLQSLPSCHVSIECLANGGDHVCVKTYNFERHGTNFPTRAPLLQSK